MKISPSVGAITSSLTAIIVVLVLVLGLLSGIVISPLITRIQASPISTVVVSSITTQTVQSTSVVISLETIPTTVTTISTYTVSALLTSTSSANASSSQNGLVYAKLDTSQGTFEVELFQSLTPRTVANFVSLANSGFYNNLVWHRIVKGFVIQTGDPNTRNGAGSPCYWGSGSSNTTVPFESVPSLQNNYGYLGMASTGAGVGGSSQFYINLANNTSLNGNYAVFGKVISGMNVVNAIGTLPVNSCSSGGTPPVNPSQAMLILVTIQDSP